MSARELVSIAIWFTNILFALSCEESLFISEMILEVTAWVLAPRFPYAAQEGETAYFIAVLIFLVVVFKLANVFVFRLPFFGSTVCMFDVIRRTAEKRFSLQGMFRHGG